MRSRVWLPSSKWGSQQHFFRWRWLVIGWSRPLLPNSSNNLVAIKTIFDSPKMWRWDAKLLINNFFFNVSYLILIKSMQSKFHWSIFHLIILLPYYLESIMNFYKLEINMIPINVIYRYSIRCACIMYLYVLCLVYANFS